MLSNFVIELECTPKNGQKYTKAGFEPLTEIIIRNDKIGIIVWTDKPPGVVIHQKEATESYTEKARKPLALANGCPQKNSDFSGTLEKSLL
ncbi:MAG TPA: hypothetical protein VJH68_00200 [Candidatus Nanoarchaeia archaeon]|nr:hypothetical protein [Candidatus Nanoarchaeia archaeon]